MKYRKCRHIKTQSLNFDPLKFILQGLNFSIVSTKSILEANVIVGNGPFNP